MKWNVILMLSILLFSFVPSSLAQQLTFGKPAEQEVEITIKENGQVHVKHVVKPRPLESQYLDLINGTHSNLKIVDEEGNDVQHAVGSGDKVSITVFPSSKKTLIEYDLEEALLLKDGIWTWDYVYLASSIFIFPEKAEVIFVNERPVPMLDQRGIKCHGCDAYIEYILDEPLTQQLVRWNDKTFVIEISSLTKISSFNFDQPNKTISFDVNEDDQFITLVIPLELLWNPYRVYWYEKQIKQESLTNDTNEIDLDENQILKHEFLANGTHIWLNFRPQSAGNIQIIGTTVIPEFPILPPLIIGIAFIVLLQLKNKLIPTRTT
jgi:hypothetical protein